MMLFLKRYKRFFVLFTLILFFWLNGIIIMALGVELVGSLSVFTAICTLAYGILFWFLKKVKYEKMVQKLLRNERWILIITFAVLFQIGTIESYENFSFLSFIFLFLLVLTLVLGYIHFKNNRLQKSGNSIRKKDIYRILFWYFTFGMGSLLVAFEHYNNSTLYIIASLFYFPTLFFFTVWWIFTQIKSIIKLKKEKTQTELLHLQSQVNPHFFFNMLNNLYGWVEKDSKTAKELILKLSDMMRYSIYEGQKKQVTLEEEITYLKNYIELHKMRYHKKIDVRFNHKIEDTEDKVMPLLFIILLENAFKHGVENLRENAYVHIDMTSNENEINFSVKNNFDKTQISEKPGIGLKNLKRRLELVYPNKHSLSYSMTEDVYEVKLTLKQL